MLTFAECTQLSGPEELSRKTWAEWWRGRLSSSPDPWHQPIPPPEVEHSFLPASEKVSSQHFSSGNLFGNCPWPKRAALPKVTCPSEGKPLSNAWLMLGHKGLDSFSQHGLTLMGQPSPRAALQDQLGFAVAASEGSFPFCPILLPLVPPSCGSPACSLVKFLLVTSTLVHFLGNQSATNDL